MKKWSNSEKMPISRSTVQKKSRRWVIKIGSSSLTNSDGVANEEWIQDLCWQIRELREQGVEVILVTSGSVSVGRRVLASESCPTQPSARRAAASLGQAALLTSFYRSFQGTGQSCGQLLVSKADLQLPARRSLRETIQEMMDAGVVPVVNENDATVSPSYLLGNNDMVAVVTARICGADLLLLLTDQKGLHEVDPRISPNSPVIPWGYASDPRFLQMAKGTGSGMGTGGMATKIHAAQRAARSGIPTLIALAQEEQILLQIRRGRKLGTLLLSQRTSLDRIRGIFERWKLGKDKARLALSAWA
ncbi:glutamate 5-kinase [Acidithiobacillus sp. CV18-2]|nr:glutamate 5-kinase [Acidithiobacillus sp. CV18-3]MBU2757990.1 glutamate 5-kinase [Acidithiobacillus sp. BN09-2]MBU2776636.1 glutamate 5-kinase [Acidithiobacillus sp. CV18-2]MBU2798649.1 glutamate 5-kinase [Acidithiobacillus sp. VAN18-4]UTV82066.1 glutamate 5-kinase [Acidithiobacillus sp. YTS05]